MCKETLKPHSHLRQRLRLLQIGTLYYHRQFDANTNTKNGSIPILCMQHPH